MDIGPRLREERERLGFKQAELAERLGIERKSQINYEAGEREPKADYLARAAVLGFDVNYVLTGVRVGAYAGGAIRSEGPALVLTAEESALVDNYRHASEEGRRAIAAAGAALAQPAQELKSTGTGSP